MRSHEHIHPIIGCLRSSSVKGRLPSNVVFRKCRLLSNVVFGQRSSSIKGRLPSKVVFHQRSSSASKVVFCQWSSSVKGRLPSKIVFCQKSSSVKGRPSSKIVFHRRSSSSFGSFSSLGFSAECGKAHLSFWLFVSSSWSTSMTSIIFLFDLVHPYDLFCDG